MLGPFEGVFKKIFGSANDRTIKKMRPMVARINELEPKFQALSDEQLFGMTAEFKQRIENGAPLDDLMPEAFATVRETAVRTLGMRHYDVQMIGGIVLHRGQVAEMKTGEGKTLTATLPVYLNALSGKGAHVVTVNDYLAARDAEWMAQVYNALGLSVGTILSGERNDQIKRAAYASDITYGTNNEFGFDYLRDNMKFRLEDYTQRGHNFAIVDEVDSILIDEARTPLIISGPTNVSVDKYFSIDAVIPMLQNEIDYVIDEKGRAVHLTDQGVDKVEHKLGIENLYDPQNMEILHHVNQALKAHTLFSRDKDYVVRDGEVVIVDEHTGRLMSGRRWSDGLHQAVEAKEKLQIQKESQTYATITFQNYFRMYDKLAGMTGTAETEAPELANIYDLEVVVIPTNKPVIRDDQNDIVYRTQEEKFEVVLEDIKDCHTRGQPVLVGTTSVEKSELVARMLKRNGIPHYVLNAKQHAREGHVVAQAGRLGAVTISTNMAGRGTDIKLGGNAEEMAKDQVNPEENPQGYQQLLAKLEVECKAEREKVLELGGLRIIGTERHESRRIDNQLRGRAGRQGDAGSSKFYLSLEDDLLRIFGTDKMMQFMDKMGMGDNEPIEHPWITKSIENAQKKVEGHNFNVRKQLLEYDDVLNQQRKLVYALRRRILEGEQVREIMLESVEGVVADIMDDCVPERVHPEGWDVEQLRQRSKDIFGYEFEGDDDQIRDFAVEELRDVLAEVGVKRYEEKETELGEDASRQIERMLLLQFTDDLWKQHLLAMDRLRDGIGLRGYGQRNPLLEYKKEGFNMFMMMTALRDESVITRYLQVELQGDQNAAGAFGKSAARRLAAGGDLIQRPAGPRIDASSAAAAALGATSLPAAPPPAPKLPAAGEEARLFAFANSLRRNDPCPCGSGQKYKKCCYQADWEPPAPPVEMEGAQPAEGGDQPGA